MKKVCLLFSGGLDSVLAAKLLLKSGFLVEGIHFRTPFFGLDDDRLSELASIAGINVKAVDITDDFFEVLKNPRYGYGKHMNPCIDCKALMLKKASQVCGQSIIATGDVLFQRPKSQNPRAFKLIEKLSGLEKKVLRPLSAEILDKTFYQELGLLRNVKFPSIKGRSRKRQAELAKALSIDVSKLPTPSGGCLLTYREFSNKVKDLIEYEQLTKKDAQLLKIGRHFRIGSSKLVVGRNERENKQLESYFSNDEDVILAAAEVPSPTAILRYPTKGALKKAASILVRYSDASGTAKVVFRGKFEGEITAEAIDVEPFRI